jgi:tRNA threonylcarbamoyladenosine biosynthesis protein TsaB
MLLCIDAASTVLTVAISDGVVVRAHATLPTHRAHAMHMHPTIARVCAEAEVAPQQWTAIAVGCGPGSYTGVRLAIATAKTLAWVQRLPVYTVSTLEAMAYAAWRALDCPHSLVVPVIDGRRGCVYSAAFFGNGASWERTHEDRLRPWDDVWTLGDARIPCIIASDGSDVRSVRPCTVIPCAPEASAIATLVASGCAQRHDDVHRVVPNYTQATEAEAKWTSADECDE